ncbi:MAG: lipopolysaccharide biosynthesis protein [Bacteroidales bacterium]|nr:lipopolysaccharide biosynthesis protein [Bacteroidales bacterium]
MGKQQNEISPGSSRVARNTLLLTFRMGLLLLIGLYTSRVILKSLGQNDFGLYTTVASFVTLFSVVTNAMASAISRFMAFGLGAGDGERLRRIFSTSVVIQIIFCGILLVLTETFGLWYLHHVMNIPDGRTGAAEVVLQCSMGVLMLSLLSVPYNATIIAHEKMSAFAYISILEAVLKLAVALLIGLSSSDKLKVYALLMLAVALIVRSVYAAYCRRKFEESRARPSLDRSLLREMTGFAGWNLLGSGAYIVNTHGVNQLVNVFFGVGVNAARGVALQIETIVRQFVSNFLTAINPRITKTYAAGETEGSFSLVNKGAKFAFLIVWVIALPILFEADLLLDIWLDKVPEYSALFVKLSVFVALVDLLCAPVVTLELATGEIRRFYLIIGGLALLVLPVSWILFAAGCPPETSYWVFLGVYVLVDIAKLLVVGRQTGFSLRAFAREALKPAALVAVCSLPAAWAAWRLVPAGGWRLAAVLAASIAAVAAASWLFALTPGEKAFFLNRLRRRRP